MFKISVNNKSVIITEDHSLVVKRENKLVSVKAQELKNTDEIIQL